MIAAIDISGQRFGYLTAISRATRGKNSKWLCVCVCGKHLAVNGGDLRNSKPTKSCGCKKSESIRKSKTKHGHAQNFGSSSPTYYSWLAAKERCENKNHKSYARYGGRGISMCERWRTSFEAFLKDMGERPEGTQIDRINNDGNYDPNNCRWATPLENGNNTSKCRNITAFGETLSVSAWMRKTGIDGPTIRRRLNAGWPPERAVSEPPDQRFLRKSPLLKVA